MEKDWFNGPSAPGGDSTFVPPLENPPPYYAAPPSAQPMGYQNYAPNPYQPQPPPPVQVQQPQPQPTVIQVVNQPLPAFGRRPAETRCPFCHDNIVTHVTTRYTGGTHLTACVLCCFCLCCCPYICDCFSDIEHTCPRCKKFLGVFTQSSGRRY